MNDINMTGFSSVFEFIKQGFFQIFDVFRHTILFGNFSLLSLFIIVLVFDLIFAAFFVTFNIYGSNNNKK